MWRSGMPTSGKWLNAAELQAWNYSGERTQKQPTTRSGVSRFRSTPQESEMTKPGWETGGKQGLLQPWEVPNPVGIP